MDANGTSEPRPTETAWLGAILVPAYVGMVAGLMACLFPMRGPYWAMLVLGLVALVGGVVAAVFGVVLGVYAQRSAVGKGWATQVKVLAINAIGLAGIAVVVTAFYLLGKYGG